jgi:hypothetical protein
MNGRMLTDHLVSGQVGDTEFYGIRADIFIVYLLENCLPRRRGIVLDATN